MAKRSSKKTAITKQDVLDAQDRWVKAIVNIGHAYTSGENVVETAKSCIESLYAYGDGDVLFKPTKCETRQFRPTFEGALSYFVGNDFAPFGFSEDGGFAIAPYVSVQFMNAGIIVDGARAIAMGNYFFTKTNGETIKVEYSFGYRLRGSDVVIDVHHSSLPFQNE
ncbi:MAG: hypothetical protein ABJZ55_05720 [Fuerstiella sp.]